MNPIQIEKNDDSVDFLRTCVCVLCARSRKEIDLEIQNIGMYLLVWHRAFIVEKRTTEMLINIQIICRNQEWNVSRCCTDVVAYRRHCSVRVVYTNEIYISRREYGVNNDLVVWMHANSAYELCKFIRPMIPMSDHFDL